MIEIVLGLVIVFLFLFGCRNLVYEPEGLASIRHNRRINKIV